MTQPSLKSESDVQSVKNAINEWRNAVNTGDIERLLKVASDDLEMIPPGEQPLTGSDAHQFLRGFVEQFNAQLKPFANEEIVVSGDWAFQRYTYELTLTPKAGGDSVVEAGHGIHMFRRHGDGSWRLVKDIFNSVPAI